MGYKLAEYDVIGNCEIDPRVNKLYVKNHHPKYNYCMDIRELLKQDLPQELYNLDILDGSPPCSVFSMSGDRGKAWGKEKAFAEGQVKQRLDDLFVWFIEVVHKLQPKIVVAENVMGLLQGPAKGYVNQILNLFSVAGYDTQMFVLNAAFMEVPQLRERVFFVARRKDLNLPKIKMEFNYKPIPFGEVRSERGAKFKTGGKQEKYLKSRKPTDLNMADIYKRLEGRAVSRSNKIVSDNKVCGTLAASGCIYRMCDGLWFSDADMIAVQTFPVDYDFCGKNVHYICGMSVPPKMMYHIAKQIQQQWLDTLS